MVLPQKLWRQEYHVSTFLRNYIYCICFHQHGVCLVFFYIPFNSLLAASLFVGIMFSSILSTVYRVNNYSHFLKTLYRTHSLKPCVCSSFVKAEVLSLSLSNTWASTLLRAAALISISKFRSCRVQLWASSSKTISNQNRLSQDWGYHLPTCLYPPLQLPQTSLRHLCLHLACLLRAVFPKSGCRGVLAPPSASSSCAVLCCAMPPSRGSLYSQLHCRGQS